MNRQIFEIFCVRINQDIASWALSIQSPWQFSRCRSAPAERHRVAWNQHSAPSLRRASQERPGDGAPAHAGRLRSFGGRLALSTEPGCGNPAGGLAYLPSAICRWPRPAWAGNGHARFRVSLQGLFGRTRLPLKTCFSKILKFHNNYKLNNF